LVSFVQNGSSIHYAITELVALEENKNAKYGTLEKRGALGRAIS
jgi:hypothetical protein